MVTTTMRVVPHHAESQYSATEFELLAITWTVTKARLFLASADFQLVVDHRQLISMINTKILDELTNLRIISLKEKLNPYGITALW